MGLSWGAPTCPGQLGPQPAHAVQQLLQALLEVLPIGQELLEDLVHLSLHARTLLHGGLCLGVGGGSGVSGPTCGTRWGSLPDPLTPPVSYIHAQTSPA